jgi:hypothetical protein
LLSVDRRSIVWRSMNAAGFGNFLIRGISLSNSRAATPENA